MQALTSESVRRVCRPFIFSWTMAAILRASRASACVTSSRLTKKRRQSTRKFKWLSSSEPKEILRRKLQINTPASRRSSKPEAWSTESCTDFASPNAVCTATGSRHSCSEALRWNSSSIPRLTSTAPFPCSRSTSGMSCWRASRSEKLCRCWITVSATFRSASWTASSARMADVTCRATSPRRRRSSLSPKSRTTYCTNTEATLK
mmetsp:Transcript_47699/g.112913  ORF Transcript_47699/g.112913 Transcript_47699/m.112913 type:complete len:205 (+) Transcript_47699:967-1581(+)